MMSVNGEVRTSKILVICKNSKKTGKKFVKVIFLELWKLTKDLPESEAYSFKKNC